ncbi:hypothetical protein [Dyella japonica]|uniref:Uncharacterized protein n=1 Tax=Dyella japonica TaxID=231455 RepID=A0ABV2K464_9GAMM
MSQKVGDLPLALRYPFKKKDETEPKDETAYVQALTFTDGGNYPLGANGFWHGGIHFTPTMMASSLSLRAFTNADGIRCMGDGRVIAYRLDARTPTTATQNVAGGTIQAPFATSFTLVEHHHAWPDASNVLVFYSLYMHLADLPGYNRHQVKMPYWGQLFAVPSPTAQQPLPAEQAAPKSPKHHASHHGTPAPSTEPRLRGWPVYHGGPTVKPPHKNAVVALLPAGMQLVISHTEGDWGRIDDVFPAPAPAALTAPASSGIDTPATTALSPAVGGSAPGLAGLRGSWVKLKASDSFVLTPLELPPCDRVIVPTDPPAIRAGDLIGYPGDYQFLDHGSATPLLHLEVFADGSTWPVFVQKSRNAASAPGVAKPLLYVQPGAAIKQLATRDPDSTPLATGSVLTMLDSDSNDLYVKAQRQGTLSWVTPTQFNALPAARKAERTSFRRHGGVVVTRAVDNTNDDIGLLDKASASSVVWLPRVQWNSLPTINNQYAVAIPLPSVWSGEASPDTVMPPANPPASVASARILPIPLLINANGPRQGTAAHRRIDNIAYWFSPDWSAASAQGRTTMAGWIAENDSKVSRVSPHAWPAFDNVEEQSHVSGAAVANAGHPRGPEDTDLARADYADLTPQMQAIYTLLLGDPNAQESAHLAHLQQAVRQPWLQNQLMRLVVRHESEWYADDAMSKWTALDPLYNAHPLWAKEKERIKKLLWWKDVADKVQGFPESPKVWHFHPIGLITNLQCWCGCCEGKVFFTQNGNGLHGGTHLGRLPMEHYPLWDALQASYRLQANDRRVLEAVCANEGNFDAVQAYDNAIVTAGACQKIISILPSNQGNPFGRWAGRGGGELPVQVWSFKQDNPMLYEELFEACGWTVVKTGLRNEGATHVMYYSDAELTRGQAMTGQELFNLLRLGFTSHREMRASKPLSALLHAVAHPKYQERQVVDITERLPVALGLTALSYAATGATHEIPIGAYMRSNLGKATVLDQHVNAPGWVGSDFRDALNRFISKHPHATDPDGTEWGQNRAAYEYAILEDYGNSRRMAKVDGQSIAPRRYRALKDKLGMP